jgi:predicted benzoate:H+ symporter BenE
MAQQKQQPKTKDKYRAAFLTIVTVLLTLFAVIVLHLTHLAPTNVLALVILLVLFGGYKLVKRWNR